MRTNKRILVKITKNPKNAWYKKGEIHNVGAYITSDYKSTKKGQKEFYYEKGNGCYGISIYDCKPIIKNT